MRTARYRWVLAIATAVCALAGSTPGNAALKPLLIDASGDANGVNDQGQLPASGPFSSGSGQITPAQVDDLDIRTVTFTTQFKKKKPTSINILVGLGGDPVADKLPHQYLLYFDTSRCAGNKIRWEFNPEHLGGTPDDTALVTVWTHEMTFYPGATCLDTLGDLTATRLTYSEVSGSTLILRVPFAGLAAKKAIRTKISNIRVEARMRFRQNYSYPVADVAFDPSKSYTSPPK